VTSVLLALVLGAAAPAVLADSTHTERQLTTNDIIDAALADVSSADEAKRIGVLACDVVSGEAIAAYAVNENALRPCGSHGTS
jgi:hypothetical protein